ncbi:dihydrofolate reductase family protein [Bailinhaonella thermotolerans]|uniref:Dihydrofolate reductase n=1 Tax=Bailinhaonella thermotolerans TaxID=1070861 RepID=A0A3A4A8A9_9ACTN|nr:dihydrofolate reductase family protein [Bailinhaonella thermotolerans]RJL24209.1 dihydrofolate reductase [Bailinhaonella thermotolerans]
MRKIITSTYITLDGEIESPHIWSTPYFNEEAGQFAQEQLFASDALLMGRRTYDGFSSTWPSMSDPGGFADRMNTMPKYVVSTTLEKADWTNTTIISDNVVERVRELKEQPGQDILMYGHGPVAATLMEHGLLDEVRLWMIPVFHGSGVTIFREGMKGEFDLADVKTLKSGTVILSYTAKR